MGMQYTTFSDTSNYHVVAHISHYISALYPPSMAIVSLFFHPMNIAGYQTAFPWDHFFSWFIRYELLKNVGCISHDILMEYLNIPPYIHILVAWTTILHGQLAMIFFLSFTPCGMFWVLWFPNEDACPFSSCGGTRSLFRAWLGHEMCILGMLIILSLDHGLSENKAPRNPKVCYHFPI